MKRCNSQFMNIQLDKYDPPLSIESWKIGKLDTHSFTSILGWPVTDTDGSPDYDALMQDSVLGIKAGKSVIWIKPYKNVPLHSAKRAYKKRNFGIMSVYRQCYNNEILSPSVDCEVNICLKDINGQNVLKSALGISTADGGDTLLLNNPILGYGYIKNAGHTEDSIKKCLVHTFNVSEDRINVSMISDPFSPHH